MISDIFFNFVILVLFGSLATTIFMLYRIEVISKIRIKALDILARKLDVLIVDYQCSLGDIKKTYAILDNPSYGEMLYKHLEKWKLEDFYPDLIENEAITLQVRFKEIDNEKMH